MKKAVHIILILISLNSFSQEVSVSSVEDSNFRYGGRMSDKLFSKLSPAEQTVYLSCLSSLGLNKDSVEWCDNDFVKKMSSDEISPSQKNCWKSVIGSEDEVSIIKVGTDKLPKPKCILFIQRKKGDTWFTLQMYY